VQELKPVFRSEGEKATVLFDSTSRTSS